MGGRRTRQGCPGLSSNDALIESEQAWNELSSARTQGPSYSSVPAWEKKFCTSVCSIPWKKICETKGVMSLYKNVVEWDDSAALGAFQNAKARFWAEFNGLPCDIPVPDPDMYIDKVDHYAIIDPELVADLEKEPPPAKEDNDANNGWDSFILANEPVTATGWGDAEDPLPSNNNTVERCSVNWDNFIEKPTVRTGWGDVEYSVPQNHTSAELHSSTWDIKNDSDYAWNAGGGIDNKYSGNAWNCSPDWGYGNVQNYTWEGGRDSSWDNGWWHGIVQNNSWEGGRNSSWDNGWGHCVVQNNLWGCGQDNSWENGINNSWGTWENRNNKSGVRNGRKRDRGGHFGFRSRKSRYQVDDYQMNNRLADTRGSNMMNYPHERTTYAKQPQALW